MRERFVRWRRRLHSLAVQEVEDGPFGSTLTGREIREPGNISWKWGLDYRDEFVVRVETTLLVMGRVCQDGSFGRRVSGERSDCPLRKALYRTWFAGTPIQTQSEGEIRRICRHLELLRRNLLKSA
jgi:hypothetical protein